MTTKKYDNIRINNKIRQILDHSDISYSIGELGEFIGRETSKMDDVKEISEFIDFIEKKITRFYLTD